MSDNLSVQHSDLDFATADEGPERVAGGYYFDEFDADESPAVAQDRDLWLYRQRTIALLRRYLRLAIEVGRLPSVLGRELFRSKVTSYQMSSFEDAVIFVHDVERIIDQVDDFGKDLIAVVVFQDYSQEDAAQVLHCTRRTVVRHFPEVLDQISERFLEGGLLNRLVSPPVENSCQEGETPDFCVNNCKQGEYKCAKCVSLSFAI